MATTGGAEEGSDNIERGAERFAEILLWIVGSIVAYVALAYGLGAFFLGVIVGPGYPDRTPWMWAWFWLLTIAHQGSAAGAALVLAKLLRIPRLTAAVVVGFAMLVLAFPVISAALFVFGCTTGGSFCFN